MRQIGIWIALLLLSVSGMRSYAGEGCAEIRVDFRVNSSCIEYDFSDNASRIEEIVTRIRDAVADGTMTSVMFCGTASPEGPDDFNRRLAAARSESLERLIRGRVNIPDSIISHVDSYIPWDFLKEQLAESDHDFRDTVVSIIGGKSVIVVDPDTGRPVDSRVLRLRRLDGGNVWTQLRRQYFGRMRNAVAVVIACGGDAAVARCAASCMEVTELSGPECEARVSREALPSGSVMPAAPSRGRFGMSLHTNVLYDLMAIPNLGVDFHLGSHVSAGGSWMYAWWSRDSRHRYWRMYGGEVNVRYWFGREARRNPLSGHHIGVYAQILTYDIEFGGNGYQGGRWTKGAGVDYGYSLPVGTGFNIGFTVGIGYAGGEYRKYHPADGCYVWDSTHRLRWFGPTKAEVSLVWLIGGARHRKGGGL